MELDYKELRAIADVEKQLKQSHHMRDGDYRVFTIVPFMSLPWLIINHELPRSYVSILILCLAVLAYVYSLKNILYRQRNAKQLTLLMNVARRAMATDPANQQKLHELQALKAGD
jgi:hypothetical protein